MPKKEKPAYTVLVVDDDPAIVNLLGNHLHSSGYQVLKAYDGVSGLKAAISQHPDLILMDVVMPAMDGLQVCRFLKNYPPYDRIPIIFLTTKSGLGDRQRGLLRGGDDYVFKPFDFKDLNAKLDFQLNHRTAVAQQEPAAVDVEETSHMTHDTVVLKLGEILDENMFSLSIMEEVSRGVSEARTREDVIKTLLVGCLPDIGLGFDRAIYLEKTPDGRKLMGQIAVGDFPLHGVIQKPMRKGLIQRLKDKTLREILSQDMERFRFLTRNEHPYIAELELDVPAGREVWDLSGIPGSDDLLAMADGITAAAAKTLQSTNLQAVPVVARGELVGALVVDNADSGRAVATEGIRNLIILCNQAGLALERIGLLEEQKISAREVERLHNLTAGIIGAAGVGIAYLDQRGAVVTWNRSMARLTGRSEQEVIGKGLFEVFPNLSGTFVSVRLEKVLTERTTERVGHFKIDFKREPGFFDIKMSPVVTRGSLQGVVFIMEEITRQVKLANRNQEVYQYLSEIITHSAEGIITTDLRGRIKSWNQGAAEIFGSSEQEVKGQNIGILFPDGGRGEKTAILKKVVQGGVVRNLETIMTNKSGENLDVSLTASPLLRAEGGVMAVSLFIRNITERKKFISQLVQNEKLASLGVIAVGMAHEINNPLASIVMQAQLLALINPINPEGQKCLDRLGEEVARISEIVNDLLVYSRGRSKQREAIDIRDVLHQAVVFIQRKTADDNITVSYQTGDGEWPDFQGTTTEILEIFLNLLINAADAVSRGGHILVSAVVERPEADEKGGQPWLSVTIRDDGRGIPAADLSRIFDPFYTTKAPGKGTGLGLMVVRQMVDDYDGLILVESEPEKGTIFTVRLPFQSGGQRRLGQSN